MAFILSLWGGGESSNLLSDLSHLQYYLKNSGKHAKIRIEIAGSSPALPTIATYKNTLSIGSTPIFSAEIGRLAQWLERTTFNCEIHISS